MRWFSAASVHTPRTRPCTTRLEIATRSPSVRYGTVDAAAGPAESTDAPSRHAAASLVRRRITWAMANQLGISAYRFRNRHVRADLAGPANLHDTARRETDASWALGQLRRWADGPDGRPPPV